jgi:hypothetical protein
MPDEGASMKDSPPVHEDDSRRRAGAEHGSRDRVQGERVPEYQIDERKRESATVSMPLAKAGTTAPNARTTADRRVAREGRRRLNTQTRSPTKSGPSGPPPWRAGATALN